MGTFARPSQRSKFSKNQSSNTKQGTGKGPHALINGSQASLNNSSLNINSSRLLQKDGGANVNHSSLRKQGTGGNPTTSFTDIVDNHEEESRSFINKSAQFNRGASTGGVSMPKSAAAKSKHSHQQLIPGTNQGLHPDTLMSVGEIHMPATLEQTDIGQEVTLNSKSDKSGKLQQ